MSNKLFGVGIAVIFAALSLYVLHLIESLPDKNKDTQPVSASRTQLTFWRNSGNATENKAYEELIADFEKANPDIDIQMKSILYSDYEIKLRTEIANGNPPDIMAIDSPTLALYANNGSLLSIDSFMREEANIEDFPEATLKGLSYKGKIYLSPIVESGIALFYNKNLFKKAGIPEPSSDPAEPMTWEEVAEIASKVNNPAKGIIGIDPAQGFGDGEAPAYFKTPFLWQFGAEVLSPDASTAAGYLDSKEAIEALQFFQDLYIRSGAASAELPPASFESGRLAMAVQGSWALKSMEQDANFTLGKDFGIAPLPKAKVQAVPNGGWALGISAKTKHRLEAWRFIKYATGYEGMKTYVSITGDLPARQSVAKAIPELNEYPANIFMEQALNHSRNRPVTPAYSVVSSSIRTLFEEIGMGGRNVREAAADAVERINRGIDDIKSP
ncbi:sugar ABC transporter substrate-binding protein [Bacillus sp. MMSF_3328]|uniref:ABC transporter substrate-binding protein n=1 Tax=Bacillus sp. MMSF_3328 TaxID=3047080 RepID=UPI000B9BF4B8|nr:sugar ABC transporter substrate-binding protein [Bacillus sp. MMSF_3328]OXT16174.1 ABC transporter substrate-binding protein [Bacillus sp. OG2]